MSFLGGGAECSTAGNPLSQFTKHVQDDKSLQRDRLVGGRAGPGLQGMRSQGGLGMSGSQDGVSWALLTFDFMLFSLEAGDREVGGGRWLTQQ